jgi:hypothetical protein
MTYVIHSGREDPTLDYDVTDATSGAPMRVTILNGSLALVYQRTGMFRMESSLGADPQQDMGFHVPGMAPLAPGPDPVIVPELTLAQVGVYMTDLKATRQHGVGNVRAQLVADPQGQRSVYVSFTAVGADPMALRYRVTLYRPRG